MPMCDVMKPFVLYRLSPKPRRQAKRLRVSVTLALNTPPLAAEGLTLRTILSPFTRVFRVRPSQLSPYEFFKPQLDLSAFARFLFAHYDNFTWPERLPSTLRIVLDTKRMYKLRRPHISYTRLLSISSSPSPSSVSLLPERRRVRHDHHLHQRVSTV